MRRRAFSLLELMVVLGLFSLMGGLAALSFRQGPSSASNKAAADLIVAQLRRARSEALRLRAPVALALPSQGGTRSSSSGLYWLEGLQRPIIRERLDLANDYPNLCIFSGFWPLQAGLNSNRPPRGGQRDDAFNPATWTMPQPRDPALIFTPSGMATSRGLVHFDQAYHWVVCSGVTAAPAGFAGQVASPLILQQASGFVDPYTITMSFQGAIQVSKGVVNASGLAGSGAQVRAPLPNLPLLGSNSDPVVNRADVEVWPLTPPASLPAGVIALVPTDRYITIKIAATDPEGDRLSIRWRLVSGGGSFSQLADRYVPMEYSLARRRWEASVEWRPPMGSNPGDLFEVNADVRDERGGVTTIGGDVLTSLRFGGSSDGLLLVAQRGSNVVKMFNPDGSGLRELVLADSICTANSIPDGSRIVLTFWGGPLQGKYMTMNPDGSSQRLFEPSDEFCEVAYSTSGRLVADSPQGLELRQGDGTFVRLLSNVAWPLSPAWSPDESRVAYQQRDDWNIHTVKPDGTGNQVVGPGCSPAWSPDGQRLAFSRADGIFHSKADGSDLVRVSGCTTDSEGNFLTWSPDGTRIAYICDNSNISIRNADGSGEEVVQQVPDADILIWSR